MTDFLECDAKRLLVVDDELSVREILAEGLASFGYEARPVGGVDEAMAAIDDFRPHLVLTDIEMPGQSGLDLLRRVKREQPELDVVMVTGVVDARTAIGAIRDGASDYVTKPFNLDEVQIVVERTLEQRRLVLENRRHQDHLEELVRERTSELEAKNEEIQQLYVSTLQALATALDYRDNETQGHSLRVVEYAVLVAERMGLTEPDLTWIRRGAILHDVGKIGIPDSVLRKPGKLDASEWEEMKRHPEMGYRMLRGIPFLGPELDIVLCHQEKFDGTGYPRGLKGEEIPLGARIFAVVDTFDAMTSDRPYRAAMSIEDACREIDTFAGRQFDPEVARAFLSFSADTWRRIRERVHAQVQELQAR